jgi:hypothetical protein
VSATAILFILRKYVFDTWALGVPAHAQIFERAYAFASSLRQFTQVLCAKPYQRYLNVSGEGGGKWIPGRLMPADNRLTLRTGPDSCGRPPAPVCASVWRRDDRLVAPSDKQLRARLATVRFQELNYFRA